MPISKIKTSSITGDAASINLNIDANTLFLDVANNRVGINNTAPPAGTALTVVGNIKTGYEPATGLILGIPTSVPTSDVNSYIFWNASSVFGGANGDMIYIPRTSTYTAHRFYTGFGTPAERLRITDAGDVGIGVTSTSAKLHVGGSVNDGGSVRFLVANTNAGSSALSYMLFGNDAYAGGYAGIRATSSTNTTTEFGGSGNGYNIFNNIGTITLGTAGVTRMTIATDGNVVIGSGAATSSAGFLQINTQVPNTSSSSLGFNSADNAVISSRYNLVFQVDNTNSVAGRGYEWKKGGKGYGDGTSLMTLDSSGQLGIGTSSPSYKLDVYSNNTSSTLRLMNINMPGTGTGPQIDFSLTQTNSQSARLAAIQSEFVSNWGGSLAFYTKTAAGAPDTTITERMRLGSDNTIRLYAGVGGHSPLLCFGSETDAGRKAIFAEAYWLVLQGHVNEGIRFQTTNGVGTITTRMTINGNGSVSIPGSLSKGSGSFRIEHPLPEKSETHELVHSFIEGPQADLIYRGKVNLVSGTATVNIDIASGMTEGTFEVLCRDVQCFTTNESDWTAVRGSVTGNILTIEAQDNTSTASISWMVIGERKDKHMYDTEWTDADGKVIVEPLKVDPEEIAPTETE